MRYCRREVELSRKLDYLMSVSLFCKSKIHNGDIDMKIYMRQSIKMMTVGQSILLPERSGSGNTDPRYCISGP